MLTEDEKSFLELPQSRLAVKLANRDKEPKQKTFWQKVWEARTPLVALSALLAALAPLYQLNMAAVNLVQTNYATNNMLTRVEQLLLIDATADAQQELLKAKELSPKSVKVHELQALIDLEGILRKNQDIKSLKTIEFRYSDVLPSSPKALYLLGTAYITTDLDKAMKLMNQAKREVGSKSHLLRVQIASAYIWIYSRKYDKDSNPIWLEESQKYYENALEIVAANKNEDFSRALIPLYHHYSFIMERQERRGLAGAGDEGRKLSSEVFHLSLNTGNNTIIGKSAASLAEKLKDAHKLQDALGLITFAIQNARIADDERGLYHDLYTLGQINFELGNLKEAQQNYIESLNLSIKNNDYRLCIFNNINLAKTYLNQGLYDQAIGAIAQAEFVADSVADGYGQLEAKIIRSFHSAVTAKHSHKKLLSKDFVAFAAEAKNLGMDNDFEYWSRYFSGKASAKKYCDDNKVYYDKEFEIRVLQRLQVEKKAVFATCEPTN
jgi:tetratricopeptide (TPR) repeat protein